MKLILLKNILLTFKNSEDRRYTMLPLDEEVNLKCKRLITIPPSFKANGISVQGDHCRNSLFSALIDF